MSNWTNRLRRTATIAADTSPVRKEMLEVAEAVEALDKSLAYEDDDRKRAALEAKKDRLVRRGKDLYQDIIGYPMRDDNGV